MTKVELRGATKTFVEARIDASLSVEPGRQLVLLGPSGCGKTTVLAMIAGLVQLDSGDVVFNDRSMRGVPPESRDAAMVFQAHALFPFRTVGENVGYGLKIRKMPAKERERRTTEALATVQLEGYEERWPSELSGGERQRVALARAVVVQPRVLLLDEPFSSLDPQLRSELQQMIRRIQQDHKITSVFVTHDRDEAQAVGDDLAVMIQGEIRQVGTPAAVFANPVDHQVASFLGTCSAQASP